MNSGNGTPVTCCQKGCERPGAYRFTWPGENEALICDGHVGKLRATADALGLYLQVIPLQDAEPRP